jgi:hypothetical protein
MEETTASKQVSISTLLKPKREWHFRLTLSNQAVKVLVVGALETEVTAADVVDGLVVDHEGAVGVLQGGVGGQDGVVRLNHGGGSLRSRVDTELELALLAVVDGQTLHQEGSESRTGTTTEGVEDQETLETNAVVGNTADLVENALNQLLADGVVATGVVVGSILLSGDHHLRVEEVAVRTGSDLVDDIGLQVTVDGTGNVLALACLKRVRGDIFLMVDENMAIVNVPVSEKKVLKP